MPGKYIDYSRCEKGVCRIVLNRPDKLNALNREMGFELRDRVEKLRNDSSCRAVVVTGAGRAFSAGGDLDMLKSFRALSCDEATQVMEEFYRLFLCLREIPVPVIAAVNGHAIGAGACVALAADLRITTTRAKFAFNFVKLGLHPGCGSTFYLPHIVGRATARELLMTGKTITGAEAQAIGLVHRAVEPEAFEEVVHAYAAQFMEGGPLALRQLKAGMRCWHDEQAFNRTLAYEARSQAACYQTEDYAEGVRAILEKRKPVFTFN